MNDYLKPNQQAFWSWLTSELSERMSQNLPFIKIDPQKILFIGEHSHSTENYFLKTYPRAKIWTDRVKESSIIKSINPFRSKRVQLLKPRNHPQANELDLIWAGPLALNINQYPGFFNDFSQRMKNQGLMMFNYLGPDTAKEWHSLLQNQGWIGPDMHDIGDTMIKAGFADPVMNMEYIHLEYESSDLLLKDLASMQLLNIEKINKDVFQEQFTNQYEQFGKAQLTLEVVYGHAWKVPKKSSGVTMISPESITRTYKK
jgi:malonyl-CoA O-methyltransferase